MQTRWQSIECDDERREVERNTRRTRTSFPDENGLVGLLRFSGCAEVLIFVARSGTGVDFVVPAAANTPFGYALCIGDFAGDKESG